MNRKSTLYLAAMVMLLVGIYITAAYGSYLDKPAAVTTAVVDPAPPAPAEDNQANADDEAGAQLPDEAAAQPPGEASAIANPTQEQIKEKVPAATEKPVVQPAAPTTNKPNSPKVSAPQKSTPEPDTTVSRALPADTAKYPLVSKSNGSYGQFHYRNLSGGRIEIDPQWVKANIVTITLPGLNRSVQVHRKAADNFIKAFTLIKNGTAVVNGRTVPLLSLIKTMDGTWVPRHVNWNPSRGLSNHSWGTAIDINAANHFRYVNPNTERNDPNLILWEKAFKPAGFSWGNRYADAMHYELLD